jgi:hypothetical protein
MYASDQSASEHASALRTWHHVAAWSLFLLLAVWVTWPQALVLGEALVGGPIAQTDGWQKVWNMWWVREALTQNKPLFHSDMVYWPQGAPLGLQPIDVTNSLLALPVLLAWGPLAGYGVAAILGFALSGWLMYLLALRTTSSWPGALVAGIIVEMSPQHLGHFIDGQLEHVAIQWAVLYMLALFCTTRNPTLLNCLWLAFSTVLVLYTTFYHALFLALMTVGWLLYHMVVSRQVWPIIRPWLVILPIVVLLILPLMPSIITARFQALRQGEHWQRQAQFFRVDLVDLALPNAYHPLWGETVYAYQQTLHPRSDSWVVAPGYLTMVLAAAGLLLKWRYTRRWGLLLGIMLCYALGSSLRVGGINTGIPLPYALIADLPIIDFAYRLPRALLIGSIPLAVLAAAGVQAVSEQLQGKRGARLWPWVCLGVCLFELAPPRMHVFYPDTAPIYSELRDMPGALLVAPMFSGDLAYQSASLRDQMVHERPIVGGYIARPLEYPFIEHVPLVKQIRDNQCTFDDNDVQDKATIWNALAAYDVTQIVLHRERFARQAEYQCIKTLLEEEIGLAPSVIAGSVAIYDIPAVSPRPFLFIGEGWEDREYREAQEAQDWRWMSEQGEIYLMNPGTHSRTFELRLHMESFQHARPLHMTLDQEFLGRIEVQRAIRHYTILMTLEPGDHLLRLTAPADPDPISPRTISLVVKDMSIRAITAP